MQDLYYISAQPVSVYFIWQLDLLIFNFKNLGLNKENIHILFAYNEEVDKKQILEEFVTRNSKYASIFLYNDTRSKKNYLSSVRPHIISKHITQHPYLEQSVLLYHDSDLLFKRLPDVNLFMDDEYCYVANTKSYLGYNYIMDCLTEREFEKMCSIVGISSEQVKGLDQKFVGGAQYIVKGTSIDFWRKVEIDSENLFNYMTAINEKKNKNFRSNNDALAGKKIGIQAWCSDMWAMLWNLSLVGKEVRVLEDLNHCWPWDHISEWDKKPILHYSGSITSSKFFRKGLYNLFPPYYSKNIAEIDVDTVSNAMVQGIKDFVEEELRPNTYRDSKHSFVLIYDCISVDSLDVNLLWFYKYFNIDLIILDLGANFGQEQFDLLSSLGYGYFSLDHYKNEESLIDDLSGAIKTPFVGCLRNHTILSEHQLISAMKFMGSMKDSGAKSVIPYTENGAIAQVDSLFHALFSDFIDIDLLIKNYNKFNPVQKNINDGRIAAFFTTTEEFLSQLKGVDLKNSVDDIFSLPVESSYIDGPCFQL